MIEYRLLHEDEIAEVHAAFERRGVQPPDPAVAIVAAAVEDNAVLGFIVVQLVPHLEPLEILPSGRGKVSWRKLVETAEKSLQLIARGTYYAFSESDGISAACRRVGMTEMPYKVFRKEIG